MSYITVLITLTEYGVDVGPFSLYSDVDNFVAIFDTATLPQLAAGYLCTIVPEDTTIIRVLSKGVCNNYIDIPVE